MRLATIRLVYKNMTWNRPKVGLYGLILFACFCTANLYFSALKFGAATANFLAVLSLSAWFVGMPMVMTLIDIKQSPKRMEQLWKVMHEGQ